MDAIEVPFEMTYPCYFILKAAGNLLIVDVEGNGCVCLFTDDDLARSFCDASAAGESLGLGRVENQADLLCYLEECEAGLLKIGARFLAIDVTIGKRPSIVLIREFIDVLRS